MVKRMTEKRYFLLYGVDENPYEWDIIDNEKNSIIYQSNGIAICKELNELHEENQELKRLIKKMGKLGGFNKHMIKTICEGLE